MLDSFKLGDLVLIVGDTENDDAIAAEFINKHGIINNFIYSQQVVLTLLNGTKVVVFLKNIKLVERVII